MIYNPEMFVLTMIMIFGFSILTGFLSAIVNILKQIRDKDEKTNNKMD